MTRSADARLGAYAVLAAVALVADLGLRRTELATVAAPFALLVALGVRSSPPVLRAWVDVERERAVEGDEIEARLTVRAESAVDRLEIGLALPEGVELAEGKVWGELPDGALTIEEHGLAYEVDLHEGQKTGFYLDQRENRKAAAAYVRGGRVLDMFSYTGGFALCAARLGGASEVLGIDGSKRAVAQANRNAELNSLANVRFEVGDGFKTLERLAAEGAQFDTVVLDPPKFARNRSGVNQALMAYHRLNRSAVQLLPAGGVLITCSCSGSVTREDFQLMLSGVAQKSGRELQILDQRGAAADHPVSATCLETEYLKFFVCRVV